MASFDNIRINTPGGTLSTVDGSKTTNSGLTLENIFGSLTVTNLGDGSGLYQGKGNYNVFNFKSLKAGKGTTLTETDSTVTISLDTSSIKIDDERYSKLSLLKDVNMDADTLKAGQTLVFDGTNWTAKTPVPDGLSATYTLDIPVIIKAGAPGVTGFGPLPEGWTATVTDPANPPYNITVTHPKGYYPVSMSASHKTVFDGGKEAVIMLGTNTSSTSYLIKDTNSNSFMIYNAWAPNLKMSSNIETDQYATIHVIMRKE